MKYTRLCLFLLPAIYGLMLTETHAQFKISRSVLGGGGTAIADSGHRIIGTLGQPLINIGGSAGAKSGAGFWYQSGGLLTKVSNDSKTLPKVFGLEQNFPNPFNPTTTIRFSLPKPSPVILKIFDLLGREAAILVNEEKEPGEYDITFDASRFSSGVYFYRLRAGEFVSTKKLMVLK